MQHAFRAGRAGHGEDARPVQRRLARQESSHVGNPHQAVPEVFGAVDAEEDQGVLGRKRENAAAVESDAGAAGEEGVQGERAGKIAQGALGVQLHDGVRALAQKKKLAGNFSGGGRREGNLGGKTAILHDARGARNVAVVHEEVEIAVLAEAGVAEGLRRKHRAFDRDALDALGRETPGEQEELRGHEKCEEEMRAARLQQALADSGGQIGERCGFVQRASQKREDTVFAGPSEKRGPACRVLHKFADTREVALRRGAEAEQFPLCGSRALCGCDHFLL